MSTDESDRYTKELLKELKNKGIGNYSPFYKEIKDDLYNGGIYSGIYDSSFTPPTDTKLKTIRIIQEDEYDKYSDEEDNEFPKESEIFAFIGGYIFLY